MNKQFKRMTIASSVALALGMAANAHAVPGVNFDPDGSTAADGGPGGAGTGIITGFDWDAGHVLYVDCFGKGGAGASSGCTIRAQGPISSVGGLAVIPAGVTYTFTLVKGAVPTFGAGYDGSSVTVGQGVTFADLASSAGSFKIFVDKTGVAVNPFLGTGYDNTDPDPDGAGPLGSAHSILEGTVKVTPFGLTNNAAAGGSEIFDQSSDGDDHFTGSLTHSTSGSPKFTIEVTSIDTNYFKDPLTLFTIDFSPDATHTDNSNTPFEDVDPSKSVANLGVANFAFTKAIVGDDLINDIYCGSKADDAKCSGQFQGDAKTTFKTDVMPEPGILALLGIGLAGLGVTVRRRRGVRAA